MLKDEVKRLMLEQNNNKEKVKDNQEKIKLNKQLPYLVGNIVEILDINPEVQNENENATKTQRGTSYVRSAVLVTSSLHPCHNRCSASFHSISMNTRN